MAEAAEESKDKAEKSAGGGPSTMMLAIVVFVMSLIAVVAGGFINAKLHPLPELKVDLKDGKISVVEPVHTGGGHGEGGEGGKPSLFYAIDPPLVVNFEDGSAVRFLQISMEIMAKDQKSLESVQKNIPLIRNNLLLLMSNRNYQSLMSREGKEKLRAEALAEIQSVQKKTGGLEIDDVLFTSFVVQ
jgi:flagellar FliL protein